MPVRLMQHDCGEYLSRLAKLERSALNLYAIGEAHGPEEARIDKEQRNILRELRRRGYRVFMHYDGNGLSTNPVFVLE